MGAIALTRATILLPVISHLAARRELTAAERNQLLRFIDELDRRAGKTGGGVGS